MRRAALLLTIATCLLAPSTERRYRLSFDYRSEGRRWVATVTEPTGSAVVCRPEGAVSQRLVNCAFDEIGVAQFDDGDAATSATLEKHRAERTRLAHRRRRIIFNNDGDDVARLGASRSTETLASEELRRQPGAYPVSPVGLLEVRTTALLCSHVDAIWYYSTWGMKLHHSDGPFGRLYRIPAEPNRDQIEKYHELVKTNGKDTLEIMIAACRPKGIEIFYSNRMNDVHDSYTPAIRNNIRVQHPEWSLSTQAEGAKFQYPDVRSSWTAWNFEVPEIRRLTVDAMREVCRSYDVDGIELDFLRHPVYFPETMRFESVGRKNVDLMTDMIGEIRQVTEEEGLRRGRPILLAARIPEDEPLSLGIGLDVRTWLDEGLVDVLSAGRWQEFTIPISSISELAHRHKVPIYPLINSFFKGKDSHWPSDANLFSDPSVWRGDAMNLFAEGADGIYMFNVFDPTLSLWRELGVPNTLKSLDRTYVWDFLPSQRNETDVYGKLRLTRFRRSVEVTEQGCEPMPLSIGEDLALSPTSKLSLRVHVSGVVNGHGLEIKLNGKPLVNPKLSEALGDNVIDAWLEFVPDATFFQKGENLVTATISKAMGGPPKITQIRLQVSDAETAPDGAISRPIWGDE